MQTTINPTRRRFDPSAYFTIFDSDFVSDSFLSLMEMAAHSQEEATDGEELPLFLIETRRLIEYFRNTAPKPATLASAGSGKQPVFS